jgi:hypothetical protein
MALFIVPIIALVIALYNVEDLGELLIFSGMSTCFLPVLYFTLPHIFLPLFFGLIAFILGGVIGIVKYRAKQST